VLPDVPGQLGHERLAEPHHLGVGAPTRVEVGATLAAADRQAGQRVLEDLLEAEELDDPQVHRGMEPQPTLVRAEHAGVLHPETAVDVGAPGVVHPRHAEDDLPLRLAQPLEHRRLGVLRVGVHHRSERGDHLVHGLVELRLTGVAAQDFLDDGDEQLVHGRAPWSTAGGSPPP
jgi:hypothetical protein